MTDQPPQEPTQDDADFEFMRAMQEKVANGGEMSHDEMVKIGEIGKRQGFPTRELEPEPPEPDGPGLFEPVPEPTLEEVQDKLRARLPLTEVERAVAARADIYPPSDYPTTMPEPVVDLGPPRQGPTLFDQLAGLSNEDRLARLERLQFKTMNMMRNVLAEIGRSTGREFEINKIMDETAPESRDVLSVG